MPHELLRALAIVKRVAANVNAQFGTLDPQIADGLVSEAKFASWVRPELMLGHA